jgi:hypothetical protein
LKGYNIMWTHLSVSFVRWFSPGTPVSSTNKTDRHDMTEILLKVALSTIKQTNIQHIAHKGLYNNNLIVSYIAYI